jgi:flagellar hook-associated protein 3 FlgL
MRVTDSLQTDTLMNNVQTSLSNYNTIEQQLSTGKKLNELSDDPIGGAQSMALHASLVDNAQYQTNAQDATSFLSASDSALSSANSLLQSAKQIAVQGANGIANTQDLQALGSQVDGIIQQLTVLANSDLHGKYLFGGTQTQTAPYVAPAAGTGDPTPTYAGNTGTVTATLGSNTSLGLSSPGSAVFGDAFTALQSLRTDLNSGDQTAISADIDKVTAGMTTLTAQQSIIGTRTDEVNTIQTNLTRSATDYKSAISNVEDVDLATVYVQFQSAQNVYQAALEATSKSFQLSLTNYMS